MPPALPRRRFICQGLLLAGGAILLPRLGQGARPPADAALARARSLAAQFARTIVPCDATAAKARPGVTRLEARITRWTSFGLALSAPRRFGVDAVYAAGSVVTLRVGSRLFEVETNPA